MLALGTAVLYLVVVAGLGTVIKRLPIGAVFLVGRNDDPLLTGLRGIAAFVVLVAHTLAFTTNVVTQHFFASIGVVIFFMLTGYLFFSMVLNDRVDLRTYFEKRIRRLVPAALVAVSLIQVCDWFEAGSPRIGLNEIVAILKNYSFGFVGDMYGVTAVYELPSMVRKLGLIWTLRFEWVFYFLFPFVFILCGKSIIRVFLFVAFLGLLFVHPPMLLSGDTESSHFFAFFVGALSAWLNWKFPARSQWPALALLGAWLVGTFVYLRRVDPEHLGSGRVSFQLVVGVLFLALVRLGQVRPPWLSWLTGLAGVQALGTISYSLYLYHMVVIYYGVATAKRFAEGDAAALYAAVPITLVGVLVSALSFYFVERRFLVAPQKTAQAT